MLLQRERTTDIQEWITKIESSKNMHKSGFQLFIGMLSMQAKCRRANLENWIKGISLRLTEEIVINIQVGTT